MGTWALLEAQRCSDTTSRKTLFLRNVVFLPVKSRVRDHLSGYEKERYGLGTVEGERHLATPCRRCAVPVQ